MLCTLMQQPKSYSFHDGRFSPPFSRSIINVSAIESCPPFSQTPPLIFVHFSSFLRSRFDPKSNAEARSCCVAFLDLFCSHAHGQPYPESSLRHTTSSKKPSAYLLAGSAQPSAPLFSLVPPSAAPQQSFAAPSSGRRLAALVSD